MPKPVTHQGNIANLPRALAPLLERPQWAVWRWTEQANGNWQKPPFQARDPQYHASTKNPATWCDYATALAAVQTGKADGLTYILTPDDDLGAIDVDECCNPITRKSIDKWAQNIVDTGRNTYSELTPSGTGVRLWGLAAGEPLNRKFNLELEGKPVAVELFRRTHKALTITGETLDPAIRELSNIDGVIKWALVWGHRHKEAQAKAQPVNGHRFESAGSGYSVDEIEEIVRAGAPAGGDRSAIFHTIVGHYLGCGWNVDQIHEHLESHPGGIGERYIAGNRLRAEIERSAGKFGAGTELPQAGNGGWTAGFETKAPQPEPNDQPDEQDELDRDPGEKQPEPEIDPDDELRDEQEELDRDDFEEKRGLDPEEVDPELEDDDQELEDNLDEEPPLRSDLPPLHTQGTADPRPIKSWLVKHIIPACGHGLLSGQWGAYKTFVGFDLAACLMTGQPFLSHVIKRQSGVLFIAAEGASEVRLRLEAVVREKCGGMQRAPFCWYEQAPVLLQKGAVEKLIAMAQQAEASLQKEFELPLGLIEIDTIAACAGYAKQGAESDPAVGQAVMDALAALARAMSCFVLGIDHFGKNLESGTRGASSKESSADVVLACLGDKQLSGSVINTRIAVRKVRGGVQGWEVPFAPRVVEHPERDEDGEAISTLVIDWRPATAAGAPAPAPDPWSLCRRQDQRTALLRLKRVLYEALAEQGKKLPIPPDGPVVRMIDQELVRERFYTGTPAEGTPAQKGEFRRKRFNRAIDWAEDQQLIGVHEIDAITYLRLTSPDEWEDAQDQD